MEEISYGNGARMLIFSTATMQKGNAVGRNQLTIRKETAEWPLPIDKH